MNQIQLIEDQYNNRLIFQFLNGTIELREDQFGAYAMCPGCGAGKTTIIKQLIALKWYEGVLYAAFTQNELNEMYQFCITLVGSKYIDRTGIEHVLKLEDIVVLHSDYSKAGTDKDMWLNRPQELMNKRIILCTHAKLLDEPLEVLISSNFTPKLSSIYGPIRAAGIGGDSNLPRQWILIDENTEINSVLFKVSKRTLMILGDLIFRYNRVSLDSNGRINGYQVEEYPKGHWVRKDNVFSDFMNRIRMMANSSEEFRKELMRDEKNQLNILRNEQLAQTLFYEYETYANLQPEHLNILYSYLELISPMLNSHLILLDGTSDITLRDSGKFRVLTYDRKYNSQVNLARFPFSMERKLKLGPNTDANLYLKNQISNLTDSLVDIIRQNERTLIFTWKNIKTDDIEINDDSPEVGIDDIIVKDVSGVIKNKPIVDFHELLKMELESRGLESGREFSIEYYGSGKDKAVNTYRNYDAVVLCGRYRVPNSVIINNRLMYDSNITATEYYANRVVQAICRTRIRRHNYMPINVYMSSDWSPEIVNYVSDYFGIASNKIILGSNDQFNIDFMYKNLMTKGITPKKAEQISKLSLLDNKIYDTIMNNTAYNCQLKLDDVFRLLPMSRKKSNEYKNIINYLDKYGVNLNIHI